MMADYPFKATFAFKAIPMDPVPATTVILTPCRGCLKAIGEHWHPWFKEVMDGIQYGLCGPALNEELSR